jgi:hypothetical protein
VFSWDSRRTRRSGHDRSRTRLASLECLEARELLAYNPLGFTLPDLEVKAFASTAASWGGNLTVTVNVINTGASTFPEPLNQVPGSASSADAPATTVDIYGSTSKFGLKNGVFLGTVSVPNGVTQNNLAQITSTIVLPPKPATLPGDGSTIYLYFTANPTGAILESDTLNNTSAPVPLLIEAPFPELSVVGLDVPPTMQPGDTIEPNIRIGNFGTTDTDLQGPVTVILVASTSPTFNTGSSIVATYDISNIPAITDTASKTPIFNDSNLIPAANIVTIIGAPVTLPTSPGKYYLGAVVDPYNQIKQIGKIPQFKQSNNPFAFPHVVQVIPGLPPAGLITPGGSSNIPLFPFPVGGVFVGSNDGNTTTFTPATINTPPGYGLNPVSAGLGALEVGSGITIPGGGGYPHTRRVNDEFHNKVTYAEARAVAMQARALLKKYTPPRATAHGGRG